MSDRQQRGAGHGKIHDETAAGLAGMLVAGIFIGFGASAIALWLGWLSAETPIVASAIALGGGLLMAYLSLRRVPDARTVALLVEEVNDLD